ncbi:PKD domain-containing protein [Elizabethkingia anophelis]|uniref:PKD domain-containing protein n=1 Tax=Elizabethkingia anophelis TaxID=1117645 RepID=UPI00136BB485|nr:PKD domain-containing protein [Elizabethkingia anophelis]MYY27275.1 PKD domain-containing protein [Elizabethkingia anophelis]
MKSFFTFNLDSKVFWSIGILSFISTGFLIYQYHQHIDCDDASFIVYAKEFSTNKVVEFYDNTKGAKNWEWDFGDNTTIDKRRKTLHVYKRPGTYIVTLTINKSCIHKKLITIGNVDKNDVDLPLIITPDIITVGETVKFNSIGKNANSWEWNFGESTKIDAIGQTPSYQFNSEGKKEITLIVNKDIQHSTSKTVYVRPASKQDNAKSDISTYEFEKPTSSFSLPIGNIEKDPLIDALRYIPLSPKSLVKKDSLSTSKHIPEISNEQFQLLLLQVASQSKTKDDFNTYICNKYDTPVIVNNKKIISFEQLCQLIAGKKIKIEMLRLKKNQQNCIENITIKYKIRKFMLWMNE